MSAKTLFEMTPGERMANRRRIGSRPGQADYAEMQLIECANFMQSNPFVRSLLGPSVTVKVTIEDNGECLRFDMRKEASTGC